MVGLDSFSPRSSYYACFQHYTELHCCEINIKPANYENCKIYQLAFCNSRITNR